MTGLDLRTYAQLLCRVVVLNEVCAAGAALTRPPGDADGNPAALPRLEDTGRAQELSADVGESVFTSKDGEEVREPDVRGADQ